jgi:hypothetical protein
VKDVNAPAASIASIAAGIGTLFSYLPEFFGLVSAFFGSLLAIQLYRNQRSIAKKTKLETELLERKLEE